MGKKRKQSSPLKPVIQKKVIDRDARTTSSNLQTSSGKKGYTSKELVNLLADASLNNDSKKIIIICKALAKYLRNANDNIDSVTSCLLTRVSLECYLSSNCEEVNTALDVLIFDVMAKKVALSEHRKSIFYLLQSKFDQSDAIRLRELLYKLANAFPTLYLGDASLGIIQTLIATAGERASTLVSPEEAFTKHLVKISKTKSEMQTNFSQLKAIHISYLRELSAQLSFIQDMLGAASGSKASEITSNGDPTGYNQNTRNEKFTKSCIDCNSVDIGFTDENIKKLISEYVRIHSILLEYSTDLTLKEHVTDVVMNAMVIVTKYVAYHHNEEIRYDINHFLPSSINQILCKLLGTKEKLQEHLLNNHNAQSIKVLEIHLIMRPRLYEDESLLQWVKNSLIDGVDSLETSHTLFRILENVLRINSVIVTPDPEKMLSQHIQEDCPLTPAFIQDLMMELAVYDGSLTTKILKSYRKKRESSKKKLLLLAKKHTTKLVMLKEILYAALTVFCSTSNGDLKAHLLAAVRTLPSQDRDSMFYPVLSEWGDGIISTLRVPSHLTNSLLEGVASLSSTETSPFPGLSASAKWNKDIIQNILQTTVVSWDWEKRSDFLNQILF